MQRISSGEKFLKLNEKKMAYKQKPVENVKTNQKYKTNRKKQQTNPKHTNYLFSTLFMQKQSVNWLLL